MIEWNKERGFFMYQILVCDDDHDIVSALEIYLTGEGYGVTGAYSGQEAIDLFQQNQFHLVLMDIMMPGHGRHRRHRGAAEAEQRAHHLPHRQE